MPNLKKFLFNFTFYPLFVITTLGMFLFFLVPVVMIRLFAGERAMRAALYRIILIYGNVVVRGLTFPFVRIDYQDYEKEKKYGACVYVCNHRSSSDAYLIGLLNIIAVQVVNNWPFRIPVIGTVAKLAGYLSVRTMPFEEFMEKGKTLLSEGVSLVAFPEGSRSEDSTVHQFNGAIFRVAQAARVPVIPICLSGNQMIPEKKNNCLNPGTIHVHKLPAVMPQDYENWTPFKLKNKVRELIQAEVWRLEPVC